MQHLTELINHYGYAVLFVGLMLELLALPTPGEALMTYYGFLIYQGKMNWVISIIVAVLGSSIGITISYFLGFMLGLPFFKKYGHYVHLGPERLEKTSKWFKRYGNKLIIFAFFIPGVRHVTGYFSGITDIPYRKFALNAYIGAFIWAGTFISLGKVLGPNWEKFNSSVKTYLIIGSVIAAVVIAAIYLFKHFKTQIISFTIKLLGNAFKIFRSLGRLKIAMAGVVVVFLGLFALVIGLIQDFLAHDFSQFDNIVSLLVQLIFTENWSYSMKMFGLITSIKILAPLTIIIFIWIMVKGLNKFLETRFLLITVLGGEVLNAGLRFVFHRVRPLDLAIMGNIKYTFPSEQSFVAVAAYGFAAFMVIRHAEKVWLKTATVFIALVVCILSGLSPLFFRAEYPSDVAAGYIFGGVWLSLNIILLEIYRILPEVQLDAKG